MATVDETAAPQEEEMHVEAEVDEQSDDLELDENLISMENIDRESPELWPEKIPGMNEFMSTYSASTNNKLPYTKEFNSEDTNFFNQLSALPTSGLIAKVKELHDIAYQLGIEESKEMSRGKCLNIFDKTKKSL